MSLEKLCNDTIEEWILSYRKYLPRKFKDKLCENLFFFLKLKYKDNKAVEEKHNKLFWKGKSHSQTKSRD